MEPEFRILPEKKLVGKRIQTSLAENKTAELWSSFMRRRKVIRNSLSTDLFSMQVFDPTLNVKDFNADTLFEKWAAVEVADFDLIPADMEPFTLSAGLYAVFLHKGAAAEGAGTFRYIFETWLPGSDYLLDSRPHFEILGEKYKNEHLDSEEDIWIPIKPRIG